MISSARWWLLAAGLFALLLQYGLQGGVLHSNDGYHYLSAAANIANGVCACSSIAHFPEQWAGGRLPYPLTHFPVGHPIIIAALSKLGFPLEAAAAIVSSGSMLLTIWLLWSLALEIGVRPKVAVVISILWIWQTWALFCGTMIGTEMLFTALATGAVLALVRARKGIDLGPIVALGVLAGLSYWVRHAGLFLIAGASCFFAWCILTSPPGRRLRWLAGAAPMLLLMAASQIRNIMYTGTWRGGFQESSPNTLGAVLRDAANGFLHLVLGDRAPLRQAPWTAFWAAVLLIALASACWHGWRSRREIARESSDAFWPAAIAGIYFAGILAASLLTAVGEFIRFFLPLFPVVLACCASVYSHIRWQRRTAAWTLVGIFSGIIAIQSRSLVISPAPAEHVAVEAALRQPVDGGATVADWIRSHLAPQEPIAAVMGQALHYLLARPVLSVTPRAYAAGEIDEPAMRAAMTRFGTRYLVLFPLWNETRAFEQRDSRFLTGIVKSPESMPSWLKMAARSKDIWILECASCAK